MSRQNLGCPCALDWSNRQTWLATSSALKSSESNTCDQSSVGRYECEGNEAEDGEDGGISGMGRGHEGCSPVKRLRPPQSETEFQISNTTGIELEYNVRLIYHGSREYFVVPGLI